MVVHSPDGVARTYGEDECWSSLSAAGFSCKVAELFVDSCMVPNETGATRFMWPQSRKSGFVACANLWIRVPSHLVEAPPWSSAYSSPAYALMKFLLPFDEASAYNKSSGTSDLRSLDRGQLMNT